MTNLVSNAAINMKIAKNIKTICKRLGTNSRKHIEYVNKSITGEDSIKMNEEQKTIKLILR